MRGASGQCRERDRDHRLWQQAPGSNRAPLRDPRQRLGLHASPSEQQACDGGRAHQQCGGRGARQRPGQGECAAHGHPGRSGIPAGRGSGDAGKRQGRYQLDGQDQGQLDELPRVVEGGQRALAGLRSNGTRGERQRQRQAGRQCRPQPDRWARQRRRLRAGNGSADAACGVRQRNQASRNNMAATRPAPSQDTASLTGARAAVETMAAISTPLTTRLAEYMPVKSRSCCKRVVHKAASKAAGKATALQTRACAAPGSISAGSPAASQPASGWRHKASSSASKPPAPSSAQATRRCVAATWPCALARPCRHQHVGQRTAGQHARPASPAGSASAPPRRQGPRRRTPPPGPIRAPARAAGWPAAGPGIGRRLSKTWRGLSSAAGRAPQKTKIDGFRPAFPTPSFHVRQAQHRPARTAHRRQPADRRAPRKAQGPARSAAARQGRRLPQRLQAGPPCRRPARRTTAPRRPKLLDAQGDHGQRRRPHDAQAGDGQGQLRHAAGRAPAASSST